MHYKRMNLSIYRLSNVETLKKKILKKEKKKEKIKRSGNMLIKGHNHNLIIKCRKDVRVMSPIYKRLTKTCIRFFPHAKPKTLMTGDGGVYADGHGGGREDKKRNEL